MAFSGEIFNIQYLRVTGCTGGKLESFWGLILCEHRRMIFLRFFITRVAFKLLMAKMPTFASTNSLILEEHAFYRWSKL